VPDHPEAMHLLAITRYQFGQPQPAIDILRALLAQQPALPTVHYDLGKMLFDTGRFEESIAPFQRAIALAPQLAAAHCNLASALREVGQFDAALRSYRQALLLEPDWPLPHYNLALTLLLMGNLPQGWAEYEWRWRALPDLGYVERKTDRPRWNGEDLNGRRILAHVEQGLGDILQFCRYVPLVAQRGGRVILESPPPLGRLLRSLSGVDTLVTDYGSVPEYDVQCPC
jgi:tetratricopeptide (TPR) repeat protein